MLDYQKLFVDAVNNLLANYSQGRIRIFSEADLQAHLFFECRRLMEERDFAYPLRLYAEKSVFSKRKKVDLVLGSDEVLVEFKMEPDYPGVSKPVVFSTRKESGGIGSVEEDLEKINDYAKRGKYAHFFMIDEDGRHVRKVPGNWKAVVVRGKRGYYLHECVRPKG